MHRTYYCCLDLAEEYERFMREAMTELSRLISRPPMEISYSFDELPEETRKEVEKVISDKNTFKDCSCEIANVLEHSESKGDTRANLSILCSHASKIAMLARKKGPGGPWGLAYNEWLALTYSPFPDNRYILWHETLHVLGADDCHSGKSGTPTCGYKNCIMRYDPTEQTVRGWPFLCSKNIEKIKDRIRECKKTDRDSSR